jgi:hypothetical protein
MARNCATSLAANSSPDEIMPKKYHHQRSGRNPNRMTHDTTDVALVAQLDTGIEILIEDDHSIVIIGPDEVEPGYENDPWADDGAHLRHVNVDTLNFTADEARDIASALIHAADHLEDDDEMTTEHVDDVDGRRTPQQHMSDVAAATLARLHNLGEELEHLETQIGLLADWATEHDLADRGEFLTDIAETLNRFGCCVPEAVRDIAATLPVRGIDYGEDR